METIKTLFLAGIAGATSTVVKGMFLAAFFFVVGLIPALGSRAVTICVDAE